MDESVFEELCILVLIVSTGVVIADMNPPVTNDGIRLCLRIYIDDCFYVLKFYL
jgi:hypothetical protein